MIENWNSQKKNFSLSRTNFEIIESDSEDGDPTAPQGSHSCVLRAASRWRHEANACEAELGAHDHNNGVADVEGREDVRPRTRRSIDSQARRLSDDSFGRVDEKAVLRVRNHEERSHATLCVAAEESIHFPLA